jgi:hypothetical protein
MLRMEQKREIRRGGAQNRVFDYEGNYAMDIPPQMLFSHSGSQEFKELTGIRKFQAVS